MMPGWLWVFLGCWVVILFGILGMIWAGSYLRKVERKEFGDWRSKRGLFDADDPG